DGDKTILGRTGAWKGDDVVRMLLDHPATAERLAWRLCELFMGEGVAAAADVKALASGLRDHGLDVGWGVATVRRAPAFFSRAEPGDGGPGPGRVRRRLGAGAGAVRAAAGDAAAGRLGGPAGAGVVLPAQRRRLGRRPQLDLDAVDDRPRQLRGGPGRRRPEP